MFNRKTDFKNELKQNIRNISILITAIILINFKFSITKILGFELGARIHWTVDFGIYSAVLSIIFSLCHYFLVGKKLHIRLDVLNKKGDSSELTIKGNAEQIYLNINIRGKYKIIPSKVKINFPYWVDFQVKPKPYLTEIPEENSCSIDLNELIKLKKNIHLKEAITFDIISNSEEKNVDMVDANSNIGLVKRIFSFEIVSEGLKLQNG